MYHLTSFNPLESNHSAVKFLKIEVITRYFPSEKEAISNGTYWHGGRTTPSDSHTFAHTFEARLNDTCSVSDWQSYKVVEEDL